LGSTAFPANDADAHSTENLPTVNSDVIIALLIGTRNEPAGFGAKMLWVIKCSAIILALAIVTPANVAGHSVTA
jgi:hypothetical protein